jgi:phosphoglucosamine mutase
LGAKVVPYNEPNGLNINEHCGSTHPEQLQKAVLEHQADLGIAFDGDADRVIMVDKFGHLIDGDHILYILATQAKKACWYCGNSHEQYGAGIGFGKSGCTICSCQSG